MSMNSLIASMPWRRRASICWRSAASRAIERCTIRRTSGSVTLLSRSVSYWLNSEWNTVSASARPTNPSRLVSRFWNSARARFLRSSSVGPLGTSCEKGGSATLMNSSSVSLPSLLMSSSSNGFMRYFRNSARVTSPFLPVSISTNHCGNGTGVPVACWAGGALGAGEGVCAATGRVTMAAARRLGPKRRFIGGEPALSEAASSPTACPAAGRVPGPGAAVRAPAAPDRRAAGRGPGPAAAEPAAARAASPG